MTSGVASDNHDIFNILAVRYREAPMVIAQHTRFNLSGLTDRLANGLPWLDGPAAKLHAAFDPLLGEDGIPLVKDALYGTWLGHPLHPMLTDLPIGFWTSSFVFDVVGKKKASDLMLKLGTVSAVGTAISGVAQWHDLQNMDAPRRIGVLHAMLNTAATTCYGASWVLRNRKQRPAAVALSTTGLALASAGGLLGGDLSYKLGIGVSRVAFEEPVPEWTAVTDLASLEDGQLKRVETDSGPVVLLKDGGTVHAASATCTHVGGPLDEGEHEGSCVECPWHGSVFDLRDGQVVHGPATTPLHAYATRVTNGQVEIRAAAPV